MNYVGPPDSRLYHVGTCDVCNIPIISDTPIAIERCGQCSKDSQMEMFDDE